MSTAGSSQKRSPQTPGPTPPPKVRFASANDYYSDSSDQASTATSATGATGATANKPPAPTHYKSVPPGFTGVASADDVLGTVQPTEHPALGPQPGTPGAGPGWYFSSDPCRSASSVSAYSQPAAHVCTAGHVHGHNHNPPVVPQPGTFYPLHHHHYHHPVQANDNASRTMAGEYTRLNPQRPAPVSYYPQIPDTSNGPMTHLYVPRFDPGTAPGQRPAGTAAAPPPHYTIAHPGGLNIPVPPFATVNMTQQNRPIGVQVGGQHPAFPGHYNPNHPPQWVHGTQPGHYVINQPQQAGVPINVIHHGHHGQPNPGGVLYHGCGTVPGPHQPVNIGAPPVGPVPTGTGPPNGYGGTGQEETIRQLNFAYNNRLFEPQDFKPADEDPGRFYYVREVDGNWTQRSRFSIDHIDNVRWYVTDEGWFYAVRLPD
ncbi:hypothetical protein N3K66_008187 [Trichothecium roseum]|uniref:Uncharacterized protein n=1 Tax=Trichothecium roseum TaxID=47278 RepID=A0ACC0UTX0_9HYPO|nr:hypothetical protein N3K66_008187 [Trichothecium roseum]